MTKQLLISILVVFALKLQAQSVSVLPIDSITGKVFYKKIIELDTSYNHKKLISLSKQWFSSNIKNFNRSNSDKQQNLIFAKGNSNDLDNLFFIDQPLTYSDSEEGIVQGRCAIKYTGSSVGLIRVVYIQFDIIIATKNGKAKMECSNFTYAHYNQSNKRASQFYGVKDSGPCKSKGPLEELIPCAPGFGEFDRFFKFIEENVFSLNTDFEFFLKIKSVKDNDW